MVVKKTILFGERVEKTEDNQRGWNILYNSKKINPQITNDSLLGKRSVIFFPGDGTDSEEAANGCCKVVQNILANAGVSKKDMPHLYGLAYAGGEQDKHRHQVLTQLKQARFGTEYIPDASSTEELAYYQPFFDTYILPLMVDEKGRARSLSAIEKNLQNITFASHCHGGFMAYQMEKMMAEKLAEFYPKEMPKLMSNVRMIHFSSRRPKGINQLGKHLDIISQSDDMFADEAYLEYDDIHKQIHRTPLSEGSALISVSPNEEILVLKKVSSGISTDANQDADHSQILKIFSGEFKNPIPENEPIIRLTGQLFRHFVEHPEDRKDVETQLKELNHSLVNQNVESGKNFLTQEKEGETIRRGILSLVSDWGKRWGARLARRKKHYDVAFGQRYFDTSKNDMLRERDDEGRFLFEELFKQYQQTGDSRSLSSFIKDAGSIIVPKKARGDLVLSAIQSHDWSFFNALGGKNGASFYVESDQLSPIIAAIGADDLYRLMPFLKTNVLTLEKEPEAMSLLMRKIKRVKKVIHKEQLDSFWEKELKSCFYGQKGTLKSLLKQSSMKEKKSIKSLLSTERDAQRDKILKLMQDRDQNAPEVTLAEIKQYDGVMRNRGANLSDLSEFKKAQKNNENLTFDIFMTNRKKSK